MTAENYTIDSWPQRPRADLLAMIDTLDLTFPNGRTVSVTMSEWHWLYAEYRTLKDGGTKYSNGFLWDLLLKLGDVSDEEFSQTAMTKLDEIYEANKDRGRRWVPSGKYEQRAPQEYDRLQKWIGTDLTSQVRNPSQSGQSET